MDLAKSPSQKIHISQLFRVARPPKMQSRFYRRDIVHRQSWPAPPIEDLCAFSPKGTVPTISIFTCFFIGGAAMTADSVTNTPPPAQAVQLWPIIQSAGAFVRSAFLKPGNGEHQMRSPLRINHCMQFIQDNRSHRPEYFLPSL